MTMQQADPTKTLFAFGLGYSAQALAQRLKPRQWRTGGTVRSAKKARKLVAEGLDAHTFETVRSDNFPPSGHWLISVPPDAEGCPVFQSFGTEAARAASITYLSTTGVYGDLGGGWAFEWTRPNPQSGRARRRVLAETQWQSTGRPLRIVRLPGIYGPGRSPFDRLRAGTAQHIIKTGQVFSRIHVDDIATGLEAMLLRPRALGVFHLCDDAPAPPENVIRFAAERLGLPAPDPVSFDSAALSPMARSFYAECKRISNARAKSALGWSPEYKNYKQGLIAILDAEQNTASGSSAKRTRTP